MKPPSIDDYQSQIVDAMHANNWHLVHSLASSMDQIEAITPPPQLLPAALWYAQQNFPVFPIRAGNKTPATRHGFKDATVNPEQIRDWWRNNPDYNIGLATGSQFDVVDIDGYPGVRSWLDHWDDINTDLTRLGVVNTPRPGGTHIYVPPTGDGNSTGVYPGIDYRSTGGYVLAPPSTIDATGTHPGIYTWRTPLMLAKED